MKITEVIVSAGRTVQHPVESYANLKPFVTLKAALDEGDDYEQITKDLQAKAEGLVEDHANSLKKHLRDMHYLSEKQRELARLEDSLSATQKRIAEVRSEMPLMSLPSAVADDEDDYIDRSEDFNEDNED